MCKTRVDEKGPGKRSPRVRGLFRPQRDHRIDTAERRAGNQEASPATPISKMATIAKLATSRVWMPYSVLRIGRPNPETLTRSMATPTSAGWIPPRRSLRPATRSHRLCLDSVAIVRSWTSCRSHRIIHCHHRHRHPCRWRPVRPWASLRGSYSATPIFPQICLLRRSRQHTSHKVRRLPKDTPNLSGS